MGSRSRAPCSDRGGSHPVTPCEWAVSGRRRVTIAIVMLAIVIIAIVMIAIVIIAIVIIAIRRKRCGCGSQKRGPGTPERAVPDIR